MHLGLICNEYPPAPHGGIGSCSCDLAEGLVAAGHRVTVVGFHASGRISRCEQNGVQVLRLPRSSRWLQYRARSWWERRRLRRFLIQEHARSAFTIVETADYEGWLPWGALQNVPTVVRVHGGNLFFDAEMSRAGDPLEHWFETQTLRRADSWVGVSRYALARTRALTQVSPPAETVIYNAVDTNLFCPDQEPNVESGLIVFVNSINPKKGVEELLQAAALVFAGHPKARLVLIGQEPPRVSGKPAYRERLHQLVPDQFRSRVSFAGRLPREHVLPWLRKAEVCCFPSHAETFGIAPIEAMAVERPTIYSLLGPGPEVIEDGVSGLLCDPYSPKDIAAKITTLLGDASLAARLGRGGRARVLDKFNKQDWIVRNLDYYNRCCGTLVKQR